MPRTPTALTLTPCSANANSLSPRQLILTRLRQTTAMAAGLEAMAERGLTEGEASPQQLDYIADLSTHLTQQLTELTQQFAEMHKG